MIPAELIAKKRDGGRHTPEEIDFLVADFTAGTLADEQMAAWLKAVYVNGLDLDETVFLTQSMIDTGRTVDLSSVAGPIVDKHSTGGVGDKATLVAVPLAAASGVKVPKLSGRTLGHTGGTLDKLESIPGFNTSLEVEEFVVALNEVGAVIAAQTSDIAPADKKIYALRDLTSTVSSIPLITASILSKKAAGGAKNILIDVKTGTGAFMSTLKESEELAAALKAVGQALDLSVDCIISDMNQPLGRAVGNALEVKEAIDCLVGDGPEDLRELSLELAARMVTIGGGVRDQNEALLKVRDCLDSGLALAKFKEMILAQGGDTDILSDPSVLPAAQKRYIFNADVDGWLVVNDCRRLGLAAHLLACSDSGPGQIDPGAGLLMRAKHADKIKTGQPIIELLYTEESKLAEARKLIEKAVEIKSQEPTPLTLIYGSGQK